MIESTFIFVIGLVSLATGQLLVRKADKILDEAMEISSSTKAHQQKIEDDIAAVQEMLNELDTKVAEYNAMVESDGGPVN